jgi:hypothetical protein
MRGPGGPDDGIEVKRGTWRLEEDRIIREQDGQRLAARISWLGNNLLVLQPADRQWGNGKSGTHYARETKGQLRSHMGGVNAGAFVLGDAYQPRREAKKNELSSANQPGCFRSLTIT